MQIIKKINKKIALAILFVIGVFLLFFVGLLFYEMQSKVSQVVHYKPPIALKILDSKDRLIANVFEDEFRYYATFDEIPPMVIETLLAVEDTLFFEHNGVNLDAVSRAVLKNIRSGGYAEGGSTITQQLVKNIALSREKTIDRKVREAILAMQVERVLSKEEILEKYLNHIYFGHRYYGIKTAAHGYFNKELANLTLKEIAMLIALPRSPSHYDPTQNLEFSLSRANSILERLFSLGWITKDEYESGIKERPIVYNQTLSQNLAPWVVDEVLRQLSHINDIKTGGYVVRTTIDIDYQKVAQTALKNGYNNIVKRLDDRNKRNKIPQGEQKSHSTLNGAIVVMQSRTGNILALVGGIDYEKSQFNRATQANRQFGSTVKPFIYQIAFDMGYSQATYISDVARRFNQKEAILDDEAQEESQEDWRPRNYTQRFSGIVTLKEALRRSLNLATINLVDLIGFRKIYDGMNAYGFKNLAPDMSIVLGSFTLSPLEAARYYSIFANYGKLNEPKLIKSVLDSNNNEVLVQNEVAAQDSIAQKNNDILPDSILDSKNAQDSSADSIAATNEYTQPNQAYLNIDILRSVISHGTGTRAHARGIELAGKTGTSNDNVDAWFSGFSPTLQVVVWYGRDDNTSIGEFETGGIVSAPVFAEFFTNILKVEPGLKRVFDIPKGVWQQSFNGEQYYFTETSKMPQESKSYKIDDNLIF